jgi:hypothetical protein
VFLDADVCVHGDTVGRLCDTLAQRPEIDAVFGSYDRWPSAPNVVSQYRNLLHHHMHQSASEQASTFWAGCGAIRRSVFLEYGGFASSYGRPSVEDIELGVRLHKAGRRVVLDKRAQVTHLKRWTLWSMIKTDVLDRGIPWTRIIARERALPNDLNLKMSQRFSAVLAYGLIALFVAGAWRFPSLWVLPPAVALALCGIDVWSNKKRVPTGVRALGGLAALGAMTILWQWFGMQVLAAAALALALVLTNLDLYTLLARRRNRQFAMLVFPLHVLYYLYSGLAFGLGLALHFGSVLLGYIRPLPSVSAGKSPLPSETR